MIKKWRRAWLLTQPTLINKRKKSLLPVVLQRQTLADGLARYLAQLGLERGHKTKTLDDILNEDESVNGRNDAGQDNDNYDVQSCVSEPLTANPDRSERCCNPICQHGRMNANQGKKFCCDRCRLDGYVLRRARAMLEEVGIVEFNAILQRDK